MGEPPTIGWLARSMRITQDVRRYAEEHGVSDGQAIELGLKEKAAEFVDRGSTVY